MAKAMNGLFLGGPCVAVFVCLGLILGCSQVNGGLVVNDKLIEGQILYESTKEPLSNTQVFLYREMRPLFSMRGWEQIAETETDESGRFVFEISVPGPYEIRWNPESLVVAHEFPVADFDGRKTIEILHVDREKPVYPWMDGEEPGQDRDSDETD